jgi:hypothetical protein
MTHEPDGARLVGDRLGLTTVTGQNDLVVYQGERPDLGCVVRVIAPTPGPAAAQGAQS